MKKLVLPLVIIAASGAYAWSQQGRTDGVILAADNSLSLGVIPAVAPGAPAVLEPAPIAGVATASADPAPAGIQPVSMPRLKRAATVAAVVPVAANAQPGSAGGRYKDGSYQGSVADAYYGNVQVQADVKNGQLVSVRILQYPNDRNTSRYINSQALPMLKQEAIQAQTAQVDFISGATLTSNAFVQSLSSALDQAQSGSTI